MEKDMTKKSEVAKREEEILARWEEDKIFEKTLEQTKTTDPNNMFVFYDGPPFATGLPHYGHLIAGAIKDVIPRYQTMRGKYVRRVWGWDCHGLPIENLIEKELGLNSKKEIEEYGIANFNAKAQGSVLRYEQEWKKVVPRMGRWIDMDHPYKTMDSNYTESVWWAFSELYKKGLIYQDYKSMHICPRCGTTLANSEVTMNYAEVKDISVTVKFELESDPGTFLLAWTTTPWTLPGNVGLAVNAELSYVVVVCEGENMVVAKDLVEKVFEGKEYEVKQEIKGADLVGKEYTPVFDYYAKDETLKNRENGWKVSAADYVMADEGTGIVHLAPAFGEEDMEFAKEAQLPFIQHIAMNGAFKPEVTDFAGMVVKKKDDTQSADIEIIKKLAHDGTLFSKEKITHSYPLCWRCDTPLLNYAADSWFVRVTDVKPALLGANETTGWIPESLKDGRFGKWLEGARDWAISRSRYWGAPLPVWQCEECEKQEVIDSRADIEVKLPKSGNTYHLMRHGEAENNTAGVTSGNLATDNAELTQTGIEQIAQSTAVLQKKNIDVILSSPYLRTKGTAEQVADSLGYARENIIYDDRVGELRTGEFDGKTVQEYHAFFNSTEERFTKTPEGGESWNDIRVRTGALLDDLEEQYKNKNILIVTHQSVAWMFEVNAYGYNTEEAAAMQEGALGNAEIREVTYTPFPHNEKHELDFHRPYIDSVVFPCECGGVMHRIEEVFDCWFESGSMPYAQFHYPFENKDWFHLNFPANFIAEGLDQTRGWFYNMLVLGVALFGESPFQHVISNGMVLAEDGQKMSKKLKNYPDPMLVADKYGADALRYYLLSSPVVHGEDLNFSEKGVNEVSKKIVRRFSNVITFYELYKYSLRHKREYHGSDHVLDRWIIERLHKTTLDIEEAVLGYRLDRAYRCIGEFVDDLSTWYLRRSRDRFKDHQGEAGQQALGTLHFILISFAKVLAPFMPFLAEDTYKRAEGELESVHLEAWPDLSLYSEENPSVTPFGEGQRNALGEDLPSISILDGMERVREIVTFAHEARANSGIKVRQPLAELRVRRPESGSVEYRDNLLQLIKDEVNVKDIIFTAESDAPVTLDTRITEDLRAEGEYRELLRFVQNMRKDAKFEPNDKGVLHVGIRAVGEKEREVYLDFFKKFNDALSSAANLSKIELLDGANEDGKEIVLGEKTIEVSLTR